MTARAANLGGWSHGPGQAIPYPCVGVTQQIYLCSNKHTQIQKFVSAFELSQLPQTTWFKMKSNFLKRAYVNVSTRQGTTLSKYCLKWIKFFPIEKEADCLHFAQLIREVLVNMKGALKTFSFGLRTWGNCNRQWNYKSYFKSYLTGSLEATKGLEPQESLDGPLRVGNLCLWSFGDRKVPRSSTMETNPFP